LAEKNILPLFQDNIETILHVCKYGLPDTYKQTLHTPLTQMCFPITSYQLLLQLTHSHQAPSEIYFSVNLSLKIKNKKLL